MGFNLKLLVYARPAFWRRLLVMNGDTWILADKTLLRDSEMPGVAKLTPARFALGLSADFRTTPGLILFYSLSPPIAVTWAGSVILRLRM
jgi:hypothetical protein